MILLWVALAWAEPQDLDTKALLAEVEARRGLTEPMLTERRDHALRLLETRGLDDDHRTAGRGSAACRRTRRLLTPPPRRGFRPGFGGGLRRERGLRRLWWGMGTSGLEGQAPGIERR